MFHRVRPALRQAFAPNRLLEITPEFFDGVLARLKTLGFAIVSLDEALERIAAGQSAEPFAVLTFDDGMRDVHDFAVPILERHQAPFTLYVTSGFADRSARLSWVELEEAIRRLPQIRVKTEAGAMRLPTQSPQEKAAAFAVLHRQLAAGPETAMLEAIATLMAEAQLDGTQLLEDLCLDWAGIEALSRHPLCTIGVHTLTHARLAKHDAAFVARELVESRATIEAHIGRAARHLAYPVGDPTSAGQREFKLAEALGFASAVTTRPGMIFPQHKTQLTALPRLSINGNWQSLDRVEILLSGTPFALWNLMRKAA